MKNCGQNLRFYDKLKVLPATLAGEVLTFPCPGCGTVSVENWNRFCTDCRSKLQRPSEPHCRGCGGSIDGILDYCSKCLEFGVRPWNNAFALFEINEFGRAMIHRYKYRGGIELARAFAQIGNETLLHAKTQFDMIVPIPLHWTRQLQRGYNQAQLFGLQLHHELNIPLCNIIRRCRRTRRQATLNREARIKNLKNAFVLRKGVSVDGLKILLIDDVFTTGSTLTEACRAMPGADITVMTIGRR